MDLTISEDDDVEVTQEELLFHSDVRENIVSVPTGEASEFRFITEGASGSALLTLSDAKVSSAN